MRTKCVMNGCRNATYNELGMLLTFHRFPTDPVRNRQWKAICKNPRIMNINHKCLFLCSQHFDNTCFVNQLLKASAVPNRNLPNDTAFTQENIRVGTSNGTANVHQRKSERKIEPDETVQKEVESFEKNKQEHSSEGDESDCSKLLETSGEDSNDSSKTSQSWLANNPITKKPRAESPKITDPLISSISFLAPSTSNESHELVDDCSAFAEFLKTRMRKFDAIQKAIAQKLISDIMFMAETKQLQISTVVLTPQLGPQFVMTAVPQGVPPPQTKVDTSKPATNQRQNQAQVKTLNQGSSLIYVDNDDSDDDDPLAKRKK